MKRLFASFLSLSLLLASCSTSTPTATSTSIVTLTYIPTATATPVPTPTTPPDPLKTPWEDRSIFKAGLVESEQSTLHELNGASVYHLEFEIADNLYQITGTEEVQYTNTETISLSEIQFRLFPNILGGEMKISNLSVDEETVTPKYSLQNSLMSVPLPNRLDPNQRIVFKMNYEVTVPQSVELNYGVLAYFEDVLALAHAYPMICVFDDEGWNAEIPPQSGDVTYGDAAFFIVRVTAPKRLTLVTSGSEISRDEAGQVQALTVASGPARDFYLAASPNYEEVSQTFGEVTIRSYAPKASRDGAQVALEVAAKAVKVYSERYAPYPYTELDIVSTPTLALGIEYPGMIAITSWVYDVNSKEDSRPGIYLESTVAHEVGHQWFYSLIGDDQLDDPWLDESLTQFITLQYYTDLYGVDGEEGFRSSLEGRWARLENANIPIGLPVAGYNGAEYSAIVYGRGPLFFVALREEMGTESFDAFLKDYTESLSWDIATPEIMQSLAEKHCNCNLQAIFDEWVYP